MSVEKVLDRVKKMFTLGNNEGATEAERETALRMAYNLLAKHNLSIADLPQDQVEAREEQHVVLNAAPWARSLAHSVASLFFCNYYFMHTGRSGRYSHHFIGKQSNTGTALYMAQYLIKAITREAASRYGSATSPQGRSFCVGTVSSVRTRINKMLSTETESTPGTALVLANLHRSEVIENDKWLAVQGTKLKTTKARQDNNLRADAFYDGKAYGKTVSLNQQVGATRSNNLLK
jgi:hypothetical protein